MSDDASDSLFSFSAVGGLAVVGGVVCCVALKIVGASILFGGLAAMFGVTVDQMTFVLGGVAGLLGGVLLLGYRRYNRQKSVA